MEKAKDKSKKGQRNLAIRIFNIIFIILFVVMAILAVLLFVPSISSSIGKWLDSTTGDFRTFWLDIESKMNNWVHYHIIVSFGLNPTLKGHGLTWSSCAYLYLLHLGELMGFFFMYTSFLMMRHLNKVGKRQVWRKLICWLAFILTTLSFGLVLAMCWKNRIRIQFNGAFDWVFKLCSDWRDLFTPNKGALSFLNIEPIAHNRGVWALTYYVIMVLLAKDILFIIASLGRRKPEAAPEIVSDLDKEEIEETKEVAEPVPVLATESTDGKIRPTVRELAIIDSANPLYDTRIETLPGIYEDEKNLVEELHPVVKEVVEEKVEIAKRKKRPVVVLPGIDEWNADPWDEDEAAEFAALNRNVALNPNEDLTEAAAPEEENVPVEEAPVVDEVKEAAPAEEAPVVEEAKEEKPAEEAEPVKEAEPVEEIAEEAKHTPVIFLNDVPATNKRPQEETNEFKDEADSVSRLDKKQVVALNDLDHKEEKVEEVPVEEVKEKAAPVEEVKVEETKEEPVEETKPEVKTPFIREVAPVSFTPVKRERPTTPIGVVEPMKKEEAPVEDAPVEETPVIAPLTGPLHSTKRSKHDKIELVEARHVAFELKNYQIKTYDGDLTPEEAFAKGATKVQPVVNPVFANQSKEPAWKQKRRQVEIHKHGYQDVTTLETLTGKTNKPTANKPLAKPTSIRDLVKAQKEEKVEVIDDNKDENKIAKPITPVAFKPVEPTQKKEEAQAPVEEKKEIKPLAPLPMKERKRLEIKPINPIKK